MQSDTTVVRTYSARHEAEFAKMTLEGSGIPSFLRADDAGGMRPYQDPLTGVRLVVRAEDAERADEVLREAGEENFELG